MADFPAIALFEFDSTPPGVLTADAMAKAAPLDHFQTGTVQPGRYLILLGGQVAALEEALAAGMRATNTAPRDWVLLPDVDADVRAALLGKRQTKIDDALAVIETGTMPVLVAAADAAVKNAAVRVLELRLGDGLGGRGLLHLGGLRADIEIALEIVRARVGDPDAVRAEILSNVSSEVSGAFGTSTRFERS